MMTFIQRMGLIVIIGVAVNVLIVLALCRLTGPITPIRLSDWLFWDAAALGTLAFLIWLGNVQVRARWSYWAGSSIGRPFRKLAKWVRKEEEQALFFSLCLFLMAVVAFLLSIGASELLR